MIINRDQKTSTPANSSNPDGANIKTNNKDYSYYFWNYKKKRKKIDFVYFVGIFIVRSDGSCYTQRENENDASRVLGK